MSQADFVLMRNALDAGHELKCRIVSDSMSPLLEVDDEIRVEKVADLKSLSPFDLIVFQQREQLICHFVWRHNRLSKKPSLTTRSLKEPLNDDVPVTGERLLGKVTNRRIPAWTRWKILGRNFLSRAFGGQT